jgi:hypothetical protein
MVFANPQVWRARGKMPPVMKELREYNAEVSRH